MCSSLNDTFKLHQRILLSWLLIRWDIYWFSNPLLLLIVRHIFFLPMNLSLGVANVCFEDICYLLLFVSYASAYAIYPFAVPSHAWDSLLACRHGESSLLHEAILTTVARMVIVSYFSMSWWTLTLVFLLVDYWRRLFCFVLFCFLKTLRNLFWCVYCPSWPRSFIIKALVGGEGRDHHDCFKQCSTLRLGWNEFGGLKCIV